MLVLLLGRESPIGAVATIMIGAVVCCAACIGGDNLQDLKCGYMLGATPWKQQLMLAIGGVSSALVMAPVLSLLAQAYGIGVPTEAHPSPSAGAAGQPDGLGGQGHFWWRIALGHDRRRRGHRRRDHRAGRSSEEKRADFRTPVLACAVGIYLPIELSVPIFAGGLVAHLVERYFKPGDAEGERERVHQKGTLFAAGLITGEALMGIFIAIPIVAVGAADVLALPAVLTWEAGWGCSCWRAWPCCCTGWLFARLR